MRNNPELLMKTGISLEDGIDKGNKRQRKEVYIERLAWRDDYATKDFITKHEDMLRYCLNFMTPDILCEVLTYFEIIEGNNPYARKLAKKAGQDDKFVSARDAEERMKVLRKAANSFGITLI